MSEVAVSIAEKRFPSPGRGPSKLVLEKISFRLSPGEFVAIVGPSGCGKTTLLNIVAGLDDDFVGRVDFGHGHAPPRIGYVFQNARLLPWRTVRDNIAIVLRGPTDTGPIEALLQEVGLADVADVFASRLSVGMSRRAAIARALAIAPDLILMDEPFVSLEETMAERLRQLLLDLLRRRPASVLFVTHDLHEAIVLADRILLLSPAPGRLIADLPLPVPRERRDAAAIAAVREAIKRHQETGRRATKP